MFLFSVLSFLIKSVYNLIVFIVKVIQCSAHTCVEYVFGLVDCRFYKTKLLKFFNLELSSLGSSTEALPLSSRRFFNRCTAIHKCLIGSTDFQFNFIRNHAVHSHDTRHSNDLLLPLLRTYWAKLKPSPSIRSDEGPTLGTSDFRIPVRWSSYIINSVDKTKLLCITPPPTQHHSFFRNYPLYSPSKL